ncbi:MAG TPA: phage holin family protein [Polyangiaceae bacterium]|nr:phage holin family protein [Polyangiaceae bacterium]
MSAVHIPPPPEPSTVELAKQALGDARELVQLEVRLARAELLEELAGVKRAAIAGLLGFACVLLAFSALVIALVLALGGTAGVALAVAAGFLVLGAGLGAFAYASAPHSILDRSRSHVKRDISELKEHAA